MIESPVLDEVKEILRKRYEAEFTAKATRRAIVSALETRFGGVPQEQIAPLQAITDEGRLESLHRLAITCPNFDAFVAALGSGQ